MNIELEHIRKVFFIQRVKNELESIDQSCARYDFLKNIYDQLTSVDVTLGEVLTKASANVYSKKWNRLPEYHRKQKIHEYVIEKYKNNSKEIEDKLLNYLNVGLLDKCKHVKYNNIEMKIEKITISKDEVY